MANIPLSGGSYVATNSITRDAVTEQMELFNISDATSGAGANVVKNALVTTMAATKTRVCLYANNQGGVTGTESVVLSQQSTGGINSSSGSTSYTVPANTTFRITSVRFQTTGGSGIGFSVLNIRTGSGTGPVEIQIYQAVVPNTSLPTRDILSYTNGSQEYAAGTALYLTQLTNAAGTNYQFSIEGYLF